MKLLTDLHQTKEATLRYFDLSEVDLNLSYAPGKWTNRELLHHLADAETVLYDRIRRIISNPNQVIWAFDQDLWCKGLNYHKFPLAINKSVYQSVRDSVIYLTEQYYESHSENAFVHNQSGARTLREEFDKIASHNRHHLNQIKQALDTKTVIYKA